MDMDIFTTIATEKSLEINIGKVDIIQIRYIN